MPSVRDELIELRGLRFYYRDWASAKPNAPTLVLLHGYTGHARSWDSFAAAMSSRYRVLALDQRGHGETQWAAPTAYDTSEMVADVEAFVKALGLSNFALARTLDGRSRLDRVFRQAPCGAFETRDRRHRAGDRCRWLEAHPGRRRSQRRVRLGRRSLCACARRQPDSAGRSAAASRRVFDDAARRRQVHLSVRPRAARSGESAQRNSAGRRLAASGEHQRADVAGARRSQRHPVEAGGGARWRRPFRIAGSSKWQVPAIRCRSTNPTRFSTRSQRSFK